jgi:hypothetical protein
MTGVDDLLNVDDDGNVLTLDQLMARAHHRAVQEGYSSRGKARTLTHQSISLCKPEHPRWHPAGNPELIRCGVCHPPVCPDVVWIPRLRLAS